MKRVVIAGLVSALVLTAFGRVLAAPAAANVRVGNQYVELTVGNAEYDTARFGIDTTGGDPGRNGDENQPLIYGGGAPWTSFTTIRVDGKDYVFGGKTKRRAGRSAEFGRMVRGPYKSADGTVTSVYSFGDVEVSQDLSIAESPYTGLGDSIRIRYGVRNTGSVRHSVGVRMVLDTMLGSNDGAPFRIGEQARASSAMVSGASVPEFWQAFDSISQPKVMAQGTLRGEGLTPPDRLFFTDWGTPADDLWAFDFEPGKSFVRKGEDELDSACVLFWDPKPIDPGASGEFATMYGLGGISIASGAMSIGITSPASIQTSPKKANTFPVVAFVENSGEVKARDVKVRLALPEGLRLVADQARRKGALQDLGDLRSSDIGQASWLVEVVGNTNRTLTYSVSVTAENAPTNTAKRSIRVEAPPSLSVTGSFSEGVVKATVRNPSGSPMDGVEAKLILPKGMRVASLESSSKPLGSLKAGESVGVTWQLDPSAQGSGEARVVVTSSASDPASVAVPVSSKPSLRDVSIRMVSPQAQPTVGKPFMVEVWVSGATALGRLELDFGYDDSRFDLVRYSRGTLMVRDGNLLPWTLPEAPKPGVLIGTELNLGGLGKGEGTVITLHGIALEPGTADLSITRIRAIGTDGKILDLAPKSIRLIIK